MKRLDKKGLSTIVATLLILLLIFVAVGIIWVVVRNVIQEGSEQISLGKFTLDLKISQVQITDDSTIRVKVKRNTGAGDFIALNFIVSDGDDSEVIRIDDSLLELEETSYNLLLENLNASNLETLQVAPIFLLESGKEVVGPIKDEYKYGTSSGSSYVCTPSCPTTAQCGSDGCGGTCGSCSSGFLCNNYQCVEESTCTDTCSSLDYTCGTVCGVDCGNCTLPGATSSCSSGSCIISSCLTGYANCDSNSSNGCETQLGTTSNCGSCGDVCSSSETCTNGDCVTTQQTNPSIAKIIAVSASSYDVAESAIPENTLDGDLNSRWSSQYDGEWIMYTLNQTVIIDEISMAFYNGDQRTYTFSVEVSTDGNSWTTVLDHEDSSSSTLSLEKFSFSDSSARYVRITGHENSYNTWNAYTEVKIEDFVSEVEMPAEPFCNDGICNNGETCSTCSSDCGECSSASGELLSFPGAEGFGKYTRGAYAGSDTPAILIVNSLSSGNSGSYDSSTGIGRGTFRWAVSQNYPRIVLFETSGTINLDDIYGDIAINNPYISVYGQSAPQPGITLRGSAIIFYGDEVLMQHIRIRVGDEQGLVQDGLGWTPDLVDDPSNLMFDHISVSWGIDENFGIKGNKDGDPTWNISVTNCIISEGLYESLHPKGGHSMGLLFGGYLHNVFVGKNLMAHNRERNPRFGSDVYEFVVANNVIYNDGVSSIAIDYTTEKTPFTGSVVGNIHIPGADTSRNDILFLSNIQSDSKLYFSDNVVPGGGSDPWGDEYIWSYLTDPTVARVSSPPIWPQGYVALGSSVTEDYVLENAGAFPAYRDAVDERIVQSVEDRTGRIIDSQNEVGGWPSLAVNTRSLNSVVLPTANPHGDSDGDGYTNLEEWLYQQAVSIGG